MTETRWLEWARSLHSIAQAGLTYTQNPFDIERYHRLQAIASEIISAHAPLEPAQMLSILEGERGYATPKLDVRGVVFNEGRILLVKELADGGWTLPGGWVDLNESPRRAAEREVWEESGYTVKAVRLLGVYDRNLHGFPVEFFHAYKLFVLCELVGGAAATSIETGGAEFYARDQIPPLSIARVTPELIDRMFEHHAHPEWDTDLD
jgi:ADP-ribose pyrophosphatase YjhB (NUDIX family)